MERRRFPDQSTPSLPSFTKNGWWPPQAQHPLADSKGPTLHSLHPSQVYNLSSPDWMPVGFSPDGEIIQFARVSQTTYRQSSFLDHRIRPLPGELISVHLAELGKQLDALKLRPCAYLFHTAFCASTLLSFCLDQPGKTLVQREPMVMSKLAAYVRQHPGAEGQGWSELRTRIISCLDRAYGSSRVIVKPSNFANALITPILRSGYSGQHNRKCVYVSNSLRDLLVSILKKAEEAEEKMPGFLESLLKDSDFAQQVNLPPLKTLNLLQQSAVFWHCQRYQLQGIQAEFGNAQVMPLSMMDFLNNPAQTLLRIDSFLQLDLTAAEIEHTVSAGVFLRHAKVGGDYDPAQRNLEAEHIARRYHDEIESTVSWLQPLLKDVPVYPLTEQEDPLVLAAQT